MVRLISQTVQNDNTGVEIRKFNQINFRVSHHHHHQVRHFSARGLSLLSVDTNLCVQRMKYNGNLWSPMLMARRGADNVKSARRPVVLSSCRPVGHHKQVRMSGTLPTCSFVCGMMRACKECDTRRRLELATRSLLIGCHLLAESLVGHATSTEVSRKSHSPGPSAYFINSASGCRFPLLVGPSPPPPPHVCCISSGDEKLLPDESPQRTGREFKRELHTTTTTTVEKQTSLPPEPN